MGYQVKYNSVEWYSTYGFKLKRNGISGRFDLQAPRDDGFDWPASADTPISIGATPGMKRIIVTGRIYQDDHETLLSTLLTFVNALGTLRDAGEFQELEFEDDTTIYWNALPYTIKTDFFGSEFNTKYAQVTIVFNCHNDFQLHV